METELMEKCQVHWQQLKIMDEQALMVRVRNIFKSQTKQDTALVEIYKLAFPEWDKIEKVNGYPEVGEEFWKFICKGFIEFDRKHHPRVFPGGIWLNNGFQSNSELDPWELSFENCTIQYMARPA